MNYYLSSHNETRTLAMIDEIIEEKSKAPDLSLIWPLKYNNLH